MDYHVCKILTTHTSKQGAGTAAELCCDTSQTSPKPAGPLSLGQCRVSSVMCLRRYDSSQKAHCAEVRASRGYPDGRLTGDLQQVSARAARSCLAALRSRPKNRQNMVGKYSKVLTVCSGRSWLKGRDVAMLCGASCADARRYLPNTSTLARFLWVVGFLTRNEFIVQVATLLCVCILPGT